MNSKRTVLVAALIGVAGAWMPMAQVGAAGESWGVAKLEGAWIAKTVGLPLQWSYVLVPDASGRKASLHGSIDVGTGSFPGTRTTPLIGETIMTGPKTAKFNTTWYIVAPNPPGSPLTTTIIAIGVNKGDVEFVGPGKMKVTNSIAYYWPTADADGDGYPDADATPIAPPLAVTSNDTRQPAP